MKEDEETVNNDMISSISKALHSPRNQQDEGVEYREEEESVVIKDRGRRQYKQSKTLGQIVPQTLTNIEYENGSGPPEAAVLPLSATNSSVSLKSKVVKFAEGTVF